MNYKGYTIAVSNSRGGKAGRGYNKTATVQVREPFNAENYLLLKQIRFTVGDAASEARAGQKAKKFIDDLTAGS